MAERERRVRAPKRSAPTTLLVVRVPPRLLRMLDELVEEGYFCNRAEAVRFAILRAVEDWRRRREVEVVEG